MIPRQSETLNKLLGVGFVSLKTPYGTDLRFFGLKLFHFWLCTERRSLQYSLFCKTYVDFVTASNLIGLINCWSVIVKIVWWLPYNNFIKETKLHNLPFYDFLIVPVIAGTALYWRLSILFQIFILFGLSEMTSTQY